MARLDRRPARSPMNPARLRLSIRAWCRRGQAKSPTTPHQLQDDAAHIDGARSVNDRDCCARSLWVRTMMPTVAALMNRHFAQVDDEIGVVERTARASVSARRDRGGDVVFALQPNNGAVGTSRPANVARLERTVTDVGSVGAIAFLLASTLTKVALPGSTARSRASAAGSTRQGACRLSSSHRTPRSGICQPPAHGVANGHAAELSPADTRIYGAMCEPVNHRIVLAVGDVVHGRPVSERRRPDWGKRVVATTGSVAVSVGLSGRAHP